MFTLHTVRNPDSGSIFPSPLCGDPGWLVVCSRFGQAAQLDWSQPLLLASAAGIRCAVVTVDSTGRSHLHCALKGG